MPKLVYLDHLSRKGDYRPPSEEFVRFLAVQVYSGKLTIAVREQFTGITKRAFAQFINERIAERLRSAMGEPSSPAETKSETDTPDGNQSVAVTPDSENRVVTTEEELFRHIISLRQSSGP